MKRLLLAGFASGAMACFPITSCIARGARVRTPGGLRPIEVLEEGDELLCVDPSTGESFTAAITAIRSARRECVRLGFEGGALLCTSDHPLYCPDSATWAPAGEWALGTRQHLLRADASGIRAVAVTDRVAFAGVHDVFDLTVDHPLHNFVAEGVLVHNKSPPLRNCPTEDGGSVFEFDRCTCADGSEGFVECRPNGVVVCQDCGGDAGNVALDAGTDGGTDGGTDADAGG